MADGFSHNCGVFLSDSIVYIGGGRVRACDRPYLYERCNQTEFSNAGFVNVESRAMSAQLDYHQQTQLLHTFTMDTEPFLLCVCVREAAAAAEEQKATKQDVWCV